MLLLHKCNCVFLLLRSFINYLGDLLGEIVFFQTKCGCPRFHLLLTHPRTKISEKKSRNSISVSGFVLLLS